MIKDLRQLIELSKKHEGENIELDCDITLNIDQDEYKAYSVSVTNRGLLFYCKNACLDYLIDSIGWCDYLELWDIEHF